MAFFSLHAYDADVWIPQFMGLNQADVGLNPDIRYAAEEENLETPNGILQPQAACPEDIGEFETRIETLAGFHRRWFEGANKDWYICCAGGKLYQRQARSSYPWSEIELPEGIDAFQSSMWSWVTYEINPEGSQDTIDVLLISNAKDGMYMIVPPDRPTSWRDLQEFTWNYQLDFTWLEVSSPKWHVLTINTQGAKFGVIERYAERIWACDVAGEPDKLIYSAPYDPTDWAAQTEIPEDGAGDILQPSWDGDRFYAIHRFGDHLLAFKKNHIWRIVGTNPGEFAMLEQFGGGTECFQTIAVEKERVFMAGRDGISIYDGMSTSPFLREAVEQLWKRLNKNAIDEMCAAMYRQKYYLAFPIDGSAVNNAMLVYDLNDRTFLFYHEFFVERFMPTDDELFITSSSLPGKILKLRFDSWNEGAASGAACKWVSPWMDFGYKRIQKGGFDLYFIPEVQTEPVTMKISMQTEKKTKTKQYVIKPLTEAQLEKGKEHRGKRLHFGGTGRKFRLIIETEAGVTAPWRLIGGIQLVVETDPD